LPKEEQYVLASQMNRSGISIPSNIAEGASRKSEKDQGRFIEISLGSSFELETQLVLCSRLYPHISVNELLAQLEEEQKMLMGYYNKLVF
jgi:four helix bundle protein